MASSSVKSPTVSIVIVNYESSCMVSRCLDSLAQQDLSFEVTVVDNPSPAEDGRNLAAFDGLLLGPRQNRVRVLHSPQNVGYGRGCNLGLAGSTAPWVCILNPDTVLPSGMLVRWVEAYQRVQESSPGRSLGLLAPRLLNENGREQRSTYPFPGFFTYWVGQSILAGAVKALRKRAAPPASSGGTILPTAASTSSRSVDWVMGAALLLSREAWEAVGGFSPDYFLYAEDTDLCWRLHGRGFDVRFSPDLGVIHTQGDPSPETRDLAMARLFRGLQLFLEKNYSPSARVRVKTAVLLDMLLRLVLFVPQMVLRPANPLPRKRVEGTRRVLRAYLGRGSLEQPGKRANLSP